MAWNYQGNAVACHAVSNRPSGMRDACFGRKLSVAERFSIRDSAATIENAPPKGACLAQIEIDIAKIIPFAGRIGLKPLRERRVPVVCAEAVVMSPTIQKFQCGSFRGVAKSQFAQEVVTADQRHPSESAWKRKNKVNVNGFGHS
jgi:hypothetical protein